MVVVPSSETFSLPGNSVTGSSARELVPPPVVSVVAVPPLEVSVDELPPLELPELELLLELPLELDELELPPLLELPELELDELAGVVVLEVVVPVFLI